MRTCEYCGRSTEGRHEQCKGCNAPLPAFKVEYPYHSVGIVSPLVASSYYCPSDHADTYSGKLEELQRSINEARETMAKAFEPFKGVSIQ